MDIWKPSDREDFIKEAVNSTVTRGHRGPYHFSVLPKCEGTEEDVRRVMLTEALAKTIYKKNPKFRYMSLGFYYFLVDKIRINLEIGDLLWHDVMVVIKGANAYAYLTGAAEADTCAADTDDEGAAEADDGTDFPFSDLDIMIYVNPYMEDSMFSDVKRELRIIATQAISQYKRLLDNMFFTNGPNKFKESEMYKESKLFDDELIEQFKKDYNAEVESLCGPGRLVISPFVDDAIRNTCSRYSFLLTNNFENNVVKVDVPHFDRCENIPLKKTPFFCSYNETIDFKRDGVDLTGKFDLYRIRFSNLVVEVDDEGNTLKEERVAADFIDVSIASKTDAELLDFWNNARCEQILDKEACDWRVFRGSHWETITCWLIMPNVATCINDLYKMLNVYESPECKKAKRVARYEALKKVATARL